MIPSYTIPRPAAGGDLATPAHDPSAPVKTDRPLPSWLPSPDYTESRRSVLEEIKKGNFDISRSIEWPIAWVRRSIVVAVWRLEADVSDCGGPF